MAATAFVIPITALVAGVISLFLDPKDPRKRKLIYVLLPVMALTCFLQINSTQGDQRQAKGDKEKLNQELAEIKNVCERRAGSVKELAGYGWSSERIANVFTETSKAKPEDINSLPRVRQSSEANTELKRITPLQAGEVRRPVTVRYYPKDVDREKVESALTGLGFRLESGATQVPDVLTNAVWFGRAVKIEDVKAVAYVLIRAGVQIKAIRHFADSSGAKTSLIEVGADRNLLNSPSLTVEEIQRASDFPRD